MDEASLKALSADVSDFWAASHIPILDNPSGAEFLRRAVVPHHPVLIRGLIDGWAAVAGPEPWTLTSVCSKIRASDGVAVTLTPDGRADAPSRSVDGNSEPPRFMYPFECSMPTALFREMLEHPQVRICPPWICGIHTHSLIGGGTRTRQPGDAVPYLSLQNDNLRSTYPELLADIVSLPLAAEAFGDAAAATPEAVNLWIGDERSISSLHKDHFENLYCVVAGCKTFTLLPPADVAFLTETILPARRYRLRDGVAAPSSADDTDTMVPVVHRRIAADELETTDDACPSDNVAWIVSDPDDPAAVAQYPALRHAHPLRVHVRPGEVLYIPPLWYHQVSQLCATIAVNFWYEMAFDHRFVFYQHIRRSIGERRQRTTVFESSKELIEKYDK